MCMSMRPRAGDRRDSESGRGPGLGDPPVVYSKLPVISARPTRTWEAAALSLRPFSLSTFHGERAGSPRGGFTTSARGDKRPSSLSRLDFWRGVGTATLTTGEDAQAGVGH